MNSSSSLHSHLTAEAADSWCELLAAERAEYRRLLRLAVRQNRYLRRNDAARLQWNASQWRKYLPLAQAASLRRRDFEARLVQGWRWDAGGPDRAQYLLEHAEKGRAGRVRQALTLTAEAAAALYRQNALNRQLVDFCMDLAAEEADIFRRSLIQDPAGCYGEDAQKTAAPPGGVLVRQA
jgi:hypothetical protein